MTLGYKEERKEKRKEDGSKSYLVVVAFEPQSCMVICQLSCEIHWEQVMGNMHVEGHGNYVYIIIDYK